MPIYHNLYNLLELLGLFENGTIPKWVKNGRAFHKIPENAPECYTSSGKGQRPHKKASSIGELRKFGYYSS
jgi:hypothetical protein